MIRLSLIFLFFFSILIGFRYGMETGGFFAFLVRYGHSAYTDIVRRFVIGYLWTHLMTGLFRAFAKYVISIAIDLSHDCHVNKCSNVIYIVTYPL